MIIKPKKVFSEDEEIYIGEKCTIKADFELDTDILNKKLKRGFSEGGICCGEIQVFCPVPEKFTERDENLKKQDAYVMETDRVTKIYVNAPIGASYAVSYLSCAAPLASPREAIPV